MGKENCLSLWRHDFKKNEVMDNGFYFLNAAINTGYSRMFIIENKPNDRFHSHKSNFIHPKSTEGMALSTKFYREHFDAKTGDITTYLPENHGYVDSGTRIFGTKWGNDEASWFFCKPLEVP